MNTAASPPIAISYDGPPVKVDGRRITREMFVPNLGRNDPLQADECPGDVAAGLFEQATTARALVIPDELQADCYSDSDESGGGFILAVYATGGPAGATCGWRDVENIVCPAGDPRADNDRRLVKEALQSWRAS
jgi:hypothetical protein